MELALVVWLMCAVTAAVIAGGKQRSVVGWFLLGMLFAAFAVVMVACLPKAEPLPAVEPRDEPRELSPAEKQRRRQDDAIGFSIGGIVLLLLVWFVFFVMS